MTLTRDVFAACTTPASCSTPSGRRRSSFARASSSARAGSRRGCPKKSVENLERNFRFLRLCDGLSLFLCLNEPGGEDSPPPYPGGFEFEGTRFGLVWEDGQTLRLDPNPFPEAFGVEIPYRIVGKDRRPLGSDILELRDNLLGAPKGASTEIRFYHRKDHYEGRIVRLLEEAALDAGAERLRGGRRRGLEGGGREVRRGQAATGWATPSPR